MHHHRTFRRRIILAEAALIVFVAGCHDSPADDTTPAEDANVPPGSDAAADSEAPDASVDDSAADQAAPGDAEALDAAPEGAAPLDAGAPVDASLDAPGTDAGACGSAFGKRAWGTSSTPLDIGVHDPSMAWDGTRYALFATGGTLGIRTSPDMLAWADAGSVFTAQPAWIATTLGAAPADLWAPDISYFGGQFHVYYAGSTFGSNSSVIGLAVSPTLDRTSASYGWADQALVVRSKSTDNFNAIDPSVGFDTDCTPYLAFGSFWSGIKLRKLVASTGKPAADDTTTYSLASRSSGNSAIEAPSIVSHHGFFYLFVSFDACCQGVNSTYRTMIGRSTRITGPYTDRGGTDMMNGAAEQLLASEGRYIGPGGGTAWQMGDAYFYVYHYYDGNDNGNSKLQVRPIVFGSDDWVTLGAPLFP